MTNDRHRPLSRAVLARYGSLALASIVFVVAIFFLFQTLFKQKDLIDQQSRVNNWFLAQTEIEYLNFIEAFDLFAHGDKQVTKDALIDRFEIFWSRLPILLEGEQSKQLRLVDGLVETTSAILRTIEKLEPALAQVGREDATDLADLRHEFAGLHEPLQSMVRAGLAFDKTTTAAARQDHDDIYYELLGLVALVLGGGAVLFFLLHRQILSTQQQAARRLAMLQATVDNIAQAVLVVDAEHNVSAYNRRALAMLDVEPGRTGRMTKLEDFVVEDVADRLRKWSAAPDGHENRGIDYQLGYRRPNGEVIEIRANPMPDGGFVVTFTDITERTLSAEQRHQSQKMEALGYLAGGVAHEFNNLLTSIGGFARMAVGRAEQPEFVRDCLDEVVTASDRAADLTRQMLTFGRKQPLDTQVFTAAKVVAGLDRMMRSLLPETIDLAIEITAADACIEADPSQMSQAVLNLVLNARDAMPAGGRLTVGVDVVAAAPASGGQDGQGADGQHVAFSVADTGTGIDASVIPHIFEPFFTTKEQGQGTGLGLAVVHGIVERSGGSVQVDSTVGHGTRFTIYMPVVARSDVEPSDSKEMATGGNAETILVVEDEPGVRNLACTALTHLGYNVLRAANGDEAIAAFDAASEPPDLLLTDIVMPGQSGPQVAAALTARQPALKVIYMSGYLDRGGERESSIGPADLSLRKPFSPETLGQVVRAVLDGESKSATTLLEVAAELELTAG